MTSLHPLTISTNFADSNGLALASLHAILTTDNDVSVQ